METNTTQPTILSTIIGFALWVGIVVIQYLNSVSIISSKLDDLLVMIIATAIVTFHLVVVNQQNSLITSLKAKIASLVSPVK